MNKTTFIRLLCCVLFTTGTAQAAAKTTLTVKCDEPKGTRFDLLDGKIEMATDRFTGAKPLFIFGSEKPDIVTIVWGHTEKYGTPPPSAAKEASVLSKSPKQITAVRIAPNNLVEMYSLYPQEGILYYSDHSHGFPLSTPHSRSFYAKCAFIPGQ